jgi:hypothetical protein
VHSPVYREYLHLARTADGWKILNAIYMKVLETGRLAVSSCKKPWRATGRRKRSTAQAPTGVCGGLGFAGHGPPSCIASQTATPVGTPLRMIPVPDRAGQAEPDDLPESSVWCMCGQV